MKENILGKRIQLLREEKKINQIEFSKILNISNTTLSQYESGKRIPSDQIKKLIADFFNVSLDFLMGRTNTRVPMTTVALHRKDGYEDDLPDEAKREIENFKDYIKQKYKDKVEEK